jgi:hypothetical protein
LLLVSWLMRYGAGVWIRGPKSRRQRTRRVEIPEVLALEPDDPMLLPDGAAGGDDADRRDAQRPTSISEVILVADDVD